MNENNPSLMPAFVGTTFRTIDNLCQTAENMSIILRDGSKNLSIVADQLMQIQMERMNGELAKAKAATAKLAVA
jgi:hypothetical protein